MPPPADTPADTPDRTPYLALARGRGAGLSLLIGVAALIALLLAQMAAYLLLIRPAEALAARTGEELIAGLAWLVGLFGSFAVVVAILAWALPRLHRRGWRTLVAEDGRLDWALLARSALLWGAISIASILLAAALEGETVRADLDVPRLLLAVVLTLWLVLIQVSAEELLFRGYLSQGLYVWLRRPWLVALPVAALFALVHMGTHVGLPTFATLAGISLFLSWITWRADRLEPAIGVHFAQNASSVYLVGWDLIPAPSLFEPVETMTVEWTGLIGLSIAVGLYVLIGVRWGLVLRR